MNLFDRALRRAEAENIAVPGGALTHQRRPIPTRANLDAEAAHAAAEAALAAHVGTFGVPRVAHPFEASADDNARELARLFGGAR